jgi:hypothetical protein
LDADAFVTEWLPDLHLHGISESMESVPKAKGKAQAKKPPISAITLQKKDQKGRKALRDSFERVVKVHHSKQKNLLIGQYLTNGGFVSTCMICGCVIYWAVSLFFRWTLGTRWTSLHCSVRIGTRKRMALG